MPKGYAGPGQDGFATNLQQEAPTDYPYQDAVQARDEAERLALNITLNASASSNTSTTRELAHMNCKSPLCSPIAFIMIVAALCKVVFVVLWQGRRRPRTIPASRDGREAAAVEETRIKAIEGLPVSVCDSTEVSEECSLCCEAFTAGSNMKLLPCGHVYHPQCIDKWLLESQAGKTRSCPFCRADPLATKLIHVAGGDAAQPPMHPDCDREHHGSSSTHSSTSGDSVSVFEAGGGGAAATDEAIRGRSPGDPPLVV